MPARIKDVAKRAGVSVATVSRVINGGKNVSDEAKEAVKNAVDELGYSPNYIARSLVTQKNNMIGVIVPDLTASFFSVILSSIEKETSENNYNILICNIEEDLDKEIKYLNLFKEMRVDGIIVMHEKADDRIINLMNEISIPIIFCSCVVPCVNATAIIINDFKASYDATKYLIDLGHRDIAFIGGDLRDTTSGKDRYDGYRKALEDNGINFNKEYVWFSDYKMKSGYNIMEEIIKSDKAPTAIYAVSDDMAVGALNCILDNGYKVPDDFSIMGFDGGMLIDSVRPKITSMQQPIREMGSIAIKTLLEHIETGSELPSQIVLKHKLIINDSCRKL